MDACGGSQIIIQRDSATSSTQGRANMDGPMTVGRAGVRNRFGSFVFLAYHSSSVIARSASGKALNHQLQTPLNRGLTAGFHPTEATLGDFVTSENAGTVTTYTDGANG